MQVQLPLKAEIYWRVQRCLINIGGAENQSNLAMVTIPKLHDELIQIQEPGLSRSKLVEYGTEDEPSYRTFRSTVLVLSFMDQ